MGNWGWLWCAWEGQPGGSALWGIAWIQGRLHTWNSGWLQHLSASMLSRWFLEVNLYGSSLLLKTFCNLLSLCCLPACSQIGVDVLTAQGLVFYFCHSVFSLALLDQDGCLFSFSEPAIMQEQQWQKGITSPTDIYWQNSHVPQKQRNSNCAILSI